MPRSVASLSAAITALEAAQLEIIQTGQSVSEDGTTRTMADLDKISALLDRLIVERDRAQGTDPTFAHGNLTGLGGSR